MPSCPDKYSWHQFANPQCCQVAKISAKKLKRGQGKIKLAGRISCRILQKVAEQGPENIFWRSSLFICTDTLSGTKKNLTSYWIDLLCICWIDVFVKLAEHFQKWPKFFDELAGKQFRHPAPGNIANQPTSVPAMFFCRSCQLGPILKRPIMQHWKRIILLS